MFVDFSDGCCEGFVVIVWYALIECTRWKIAGWVDGHVQFLAVVVARATTEGQSMSVHVDAFSGVFLQDDLYAQQVGCCLWNVEGRKL